MQVHIYVYISVRVCVYIELMNYIYTFTIWPHDFNLL